MRWIDENRRVVPVGSPAFSPPPRSTQAPIRPSPRLQPNRPPPFSPLSGGHPVPDPVNSVGPRLLHIHRDRQSSFVLDKCSLRVLASCAAGLPPPKLAAGGAERECMRSHRHGVGLPRILRRESQSTTPGNAARKTTRQRCSLFLAHTETAHDGRSRRAPLRKVRISGWPSLRQQGDAHRRHFDRHHPRAAHFHSFEQ